MKDEGKYLLIFSQSIIYFDLIWKVYLNLFEFIAALLILRLKKKILSSCVRAVICPLSYLLAYIWNIVFAKFYLIIIDSIVGAAQFSD